MKIFVTGTRGIPDIPGGVEKHCQELYPRIAALGHEVILAIRTPYTQERRDAWHGVKLAHIYAPRRKSLEAIVHTFLAVIKARLCNPDIVHIHAVGPGLMAPLARLLGLKVVITNHGPDYDRQKWGTAAKAMLRLGEYLGGKFAHEVIVISQVIGDIISSRCHRSYHLIYNGVVAPRLALEHAYLDKIGVKPGRYLLAVSRFVPEKGLHHLITIFSSIKNDYKLVIAGDADHETEYSKALKRSAATYPSIILTGYVTGSPLNELFSHAGIFILPSYHEGLPIALLEALSYGSEVLVSDIPANLEMMLPAECYFRCGDEQDLKRRLLNLLEHPTPENIRHNRQTTILQKYNWDLIADQTISVYRKAIGKSS